MTRTALITVLAAASVASAGQPTTEFLPVGFLISDLSQDGSVGAGNAVGDGSYETFRWTRAGGIDRLGLATVPVLGTGAGSPDISYDGTRISATILSSDTNATQGIWDLSTGWQETMPPMPADGQVLDRSYGSAWGLSGDGSTLTGFYWSSGRAQPSKWSEATGMVALPRETGRSARVNGASHDGSVVVGWHAHSTGIWQPTAWRGATRITLYPSLTNAGAEAVSADGSVVVGNVYDETLAIRVASIWRWDGSAYIMQTVGALPGTTGQAYFIGVTDDGQMAVGSNIFATSPGGPRSGIVWTPATGLVDATAFLTSLGLSVPANIQVRELSSISADGSTISAIVFDTSISQFQTMLIHLDGLCVVDLNGDGMVDFADYLEFLNLFDAGDLRVDFTGDGLVDFADYLEFLNLFDAGC